ncbi:zinc ribbon domain-containing protein [candidate division WOR-3 bacterium]|nr:zinc ribbon domain-containing protein [candidate division WOR-3 bacterium]
MRCPHCGEPVDATQERCFACGQRTRARGLRRDRPVDPRILILGGVALLAVVAGLVVTLAPKAGRQAPERRPRRSSVSDSARQATRDTARVSVSEDRQHRSLARIDKLQRRYEDIRTETVTGSPTPEQARLMNEIDAGLREVRSLVAGLAGSMAGSARDSLEGRISRAERDLGGLISRFARAPKNR